MRFSVSSIMEFIKPLMAKQSAGRAFTLHAISFAQFALRIR